MAELTGVYAASHGPMIVRNWGKLSAAERDSLTVAFTELGRRMRAARPDVLIVISPDHWVNFFIDNLPAICVGVGEVHDGPPEPWLHQFPHRSLAGHPALAEHIARHAHEHDFEPYMRRVQQDTLPIYRALTPTEEELMIREFILQMKLGHVHRSYFRNKFGVDVHQRFAGSLDHLEHQGFLRRAGQAVKGDQHRQGNRRAQRAKPCPNP